MKFKILEQKILQGIPSASGLVKYQEFYYVVGDDSPFIFQLNDKLEPIDRFRIIDSPGSNPIAKHDKPDFEALEMISEDEILSFGSGSRSPQRDIMVKIKLGQSTSLKSYSLTKFFSRLKNMEVLRNSELNIEAAAFHQDILYLFNRGKNVIFTLNFCDFISVPEDPGSKSEISYSEFKLPEINGIEAGFSGATITTSGTLVVTCSVEDTPNAYDDGEVLGSFLGIASKEEENCFSAISWTRIDPDQAPLKVESVCVEHEITGKSLDVVLVTDSDGGDSLILRGKVEF